MGNKKIKEFVVSKKDAVFWLDRHGIWHNEDEKFQNRRIINYFHSCIKKDRGGYYLAQTHSTHKEKVYFPYEDTALFVFDVIKGEEINLVLNTKKRIRLKPRRLFIKDDGLYTHDGEDRIKFSEHALVRIAVLIEDENEECFIRVKNRRYRIPQLL